MENANKELIRMLLEYEITGGENKATVWGIVVYLLKEVYGCQNSTVDTILKEALKRYKTYGPAGGIK